MLKLHCDIAVQLFLYPMNYQIDIDGYIGPYAYSKQYVKQKLTENKGKEVSVRMNSLGGALDHGLDMAAQFKEHGKVTVYMMGFNASSATVASLGAAKVSMDENGFYLVHKVSNWVDAWGMMNADQLASVIQDLTKNKQENDKIDLVLARMYAKKTGKNVSDILAVLKEGSWLSAQEALEYGFIDEIIQGTGTKVNLTDQLREKFNAYGLPEPPDAEHGSKFMFSFFSRQFTDLRNLISSSKEDSTNQTPKTIVVKKDNFKHVNEILSVQNIVFTDGKSALTEEQFQKLNERLETLEKEKKEQEKQIENLKKKPGDDTTSIHDEDDDDEEEKDNSVYSRSKDFFNKVSDLI